MGSVGEGKGAEGACSSLVAGERASIFCSLFFHVRVRCERLSGVREGLTFGFGRRSAVRGAWCH